MILSEKSKTMMVGGKFGGGEVNLVKMRKTAEKWGRGTRIGSMSKVNGKMEKDSGRLIWELLVRPCLEYASQL